jgi:hypothetical protein
LKKNGRFPMSSNPILRWPLGVCLCIAPILAGRSAAANESLTIAGACVDLDGNPVAGANVRLFWLYVSGNGSDKFKQRGEMQTMETGSFRFANTPALLVGHEDDSSDYYLVVTHPRFASAVVQAISCRPFINNHDHLDDLKVTLEPPGALTGTVTDTDGKPIAGATVYRPTLIGQTMVDVWRDFTDVHGRYKISDLPDWNGNQTVQSNGRATLSGFRYVFYARHPDYGEKQDSFGEIPATVDFQLEPAGVIQGVAVDTITGLPAAGVKIQAQGIDAHGFVQAQADEAGHYRLGSLVADRYNVWARASDRTVVAIPALAVRAGETVEAPNLELISGGFITGNVLHYETKQPVVQTKEGWRLRVALEGPSRPKPGAAVESIAVANDGSFRIRAAPGANVTYLQTPWIVKSPLQRMPLIVREGETITLDIYVDPSIEFNRGLPAAK